MRADDVNTTLNLGATAPEPDPIVLGYGDPGLFAGPAADPGEHARLRRAIGSVLRPVVPLDRLGDTIDAVEQVAVEYFAASAPASTGGNDDA